jgi:RHS repeat-associated protein
MFFRLLIFLIACLSYVPVNAESMSVALLCSTASDPDALVEKCVNTLNGDYCEVVLDLIIPGPDPLILQRFHNSKNYATGQGYGGWRIFPQMLLVLGKDPLKKECKVGGEHFEWTYAFTGERSGSILTYSGWKRTEGDTKDPLKINAQKDALGLSNTYAEEINGQTNHLNNRLSVKGDSCVLVLGDGTKRLFQKTTIPPTTPFCNLHSELSAKVLQPNYYRLVSETLPSGNSILFSYNEQGQLSRVEVQNKSEKSHSWIQFILKGDTLTLETSDARTLHYKFEKINDILVLKETTGSHCIPCMYDYQANGKYCYLIRKRLPEGRFLEIEYDGQGRVAALKKPHPESGNSFLSKQFLYDADYTDVVNALNIKTRYHYNDKLQLTSLDYFNETGSLYRVDRKYYGTAQEISYLNARTIADGTGKIFSYRTFKYDEAGNILEEKLYGNLSGKEDPNLIVDAKGKLLNPEQTECHTKSFTYSNDGFNLLTSLGDCRGNQTIYHFQPGTNLLIKKFIREKTKIRNRTFHFYNDDGVCIKTIEDDSSEEKTDSLSWLTSERHITYIHPKIELPGIGLPEMIEEKAFDLNKNNEILIKKLVNTYSPQGNLLSCSRYGSDGALGFTVNKTYNQLGQPLTETDPAGQTITHTYSSNGELILKKIPHEQRKIENKYDLLGRLISKVEKAGPLIAQENYAYDLSNRKIATKDRFGNHTFYEYDAFNRLIKIIYPRVLDEHESPVNPTFTYTYDIFGNVTSITDPKGYVTRKTYNLRGSPVDIYYPDGSSELFKYDPEGSLHSSSTRDCMITLYQYDYLGRLIYEEERTPNDSGGSSFYKCRLRTYNGFRCTSVSEDPLITDYKYDYAGNIVGIIQRRSGEGENHTETRKTEIIYDSLGREAAKKVWHDSGPLDYSVNSFTYDLVGNVINKKVEDSQGNILLQKNFAYDSAGRCIEESDNQTRLETIYDSFGEPIAYKDTAGDVTQILIEYSNPFKKTILNPLGLTTVLTFDALGRLTSTIKKDAHGTLLSSQYILYDSVGNKCIEKNDVIINGRIKSQQITRWIYGPMGRLEKLIEAESSPEEQTTTFIYNSLGQVVSKTLPGTSQPLTYTYNQAGYLCKVQYHDPNKDLSISNNYSYNEKGNIISAYALDGISVNRECNIYGQVTREIVYDGEHTYALRCQYDRKGRLKKISLPDDSSIHYTYDALLGKEVIRCAANGSETYRHAYNAYDTSGRLCEETLIGYCGERIIQYENGQKSEISTDWLNEKRAYDGLGHLTSVTKKADFEAPNEKYNYNTLSQLIADSYNVYHYDSVDNRLKTNQEILLCNSLNQLVKVGQVECSYDPLGNLSKKILDGEETHFVSNILSQLVAIKKTDQTALYFSYDPFGRRLTKKVCDISGKHKKVLTVSRSFYLGNHELGFLSTKGEITHLRVLGISGNQVDHKCIAIEVKGKAYAPLHDSAGNITTLLDPNSREVIENYVYSGFGEVKIYVQEQEVSHSPVGNPWRFAEKPIDEESGLINFGFRFYDPSIGRFISKDPSDQDGPNLYAYLHNNPVNYTDHFGLITEDIEVFLAWGPTGRAPPERGTGGDLDKTIGAGLPTIRYCDTFEKMFAVPLRIDPWKQHFMYEPSKVYQVGGEEMLDLGIGFTNGMGNDFESARASAEYLSRLAGGYCIHAVYNATHGHQANLLECKLGLSYIATEPVRLIHQMWNNFFERGSARAKFLMVCHSQGVIHVRNALLDYPPELRERIIVVAIAPGAYVYRQTCAQVTHYRNASAQRDLVPRIDRAGAARSKETIVNVISHPDAGWFDHEFQSSTYENYLSDEIYFFFKKFK